MDTLVILGFSLVVIYAFVIIVSMIRVRKIYRPIETSALLYNEYNKTNSVEVYLNELLNEFRLVNELIRVKQHEIQFYKTRIFDYHILLQFNRVKPTREQLNRAESELISLTDRRLKLVYSDSLNQQIPLTMAYKNSYNMLFHFFKKINQNNPLSELMKTDGFGLYINSSNFLYILPYYCILYHNKKQYMRVLTVESFKIRHVFYQEEVLTTSHDDEILITSWRYRRRDGGPDRRYSNNYATYTVRRAKIIISEQGLGDIYQENHSNTTKALNKEKIFNQYLDEYKTNLSNKVKTSFNVPLPIVISKDQNVISSLKESLIIEFNQSLLGLLKENYDNSIWQNIIRTHRDLILKIQNFKTDEINEEDFKRKIDEHIVPIKNQYYKEIINYSDDYYYADWVKSLVEKKDKATKNKNYINRFMQENLVSEAYKNVEQMQHKINYMINLFSEWKNHLEDDFLLKKLIPWIVGLFIKNQIIWIRHNLGYTRFVLKNLPKKFIDEFNKTFEDIQNKIALIKYQIFNHKYFYQNSLGRFKNDLEAKQQVSDFIDFIGILENQIKGMDFINYLLAFGKIDISCLFDKKDNHAFDNINYLSFKISLESSDEKQSNGSTNKISLSVDRHSNRLIPQVSLQSNLYLSDDTIKKIIEVSSRTFSSNSIGIGDDLELLTILKYAFDKMSKHNLSINDLIKERFIACDMDPSFRDINAKNIKRYISINKSISLYDFINPTIEDLIREFNRKKVEYQRLPLEIFKYSPHHTIKNKFDFIMSNNHIDFYISRSEIQKNEAFNQVIRHPLLLKKHLDKFLNCRTAIKKELVEIDLLVSVLRAKYKNMNLTYFDWIQILGLQEILDLIFTLNDDTFSHTNYFKSLLTDLSKIENDFLVNLGRFYGSTLNKHELLEVCVYLYHQQKFNSEHIDVIKRRFNIEDLNPIDYIQEINYWGFDSTSIHNSILLKRIEMEIASEVFHQGFHNLKNSYKKHIKDIEAVHLDIFPLFYMEFKKIFEEKYYFFDVFIIRDTRQKINNRVAVSKETSFNLDDESIHQLIERIDGLQSNGYLSLKKLVSKTRVFMMKNNLSTVNDLAYVIQRYTTNILIDNQHLIINPKKHIHLFKDYLRDYFLSQEVVYYNVLYEYFCEDMQLNEKELIDEIVNIENDLFMLSRNQWVIKDKLVGFSDKSIDIVRDVLNNELAIREYINLSRLDNPDILSLKFSYSGQSFSVSPELLTSIISTFLHDEYKFLSRAGIGNDEQSIIVLNHQSASSIDDLIYKIFIKHFDDYENLSKQKINDFVISKGLSNKKLSNEFFEMHGFYEDEFGRLFYDRKD